MSRRLPAEGPGLGVGGDHRPGGHGEGVPAGVVGAVGQVDEDAQLAAGADHVAPEAGQAGGIVQLGARVGPGGRAQVAGAQDPHATAVVLAQHLEAVGDEAAHQHQHHGHPAVGDDPGDVLAGAGDLDMFGAGLGELAVLVEVHQHALDQLLPFEEGLPLPGAADRLGQGIEERRLGHVALLHPEGLDDHVDPPAQDLLQVHRGRVGVDHGEPPVELVVRSVIEAVVQDVVGRRVQPADLPAQGQAQPRGLAAVDVADGDVGAALHEGSPVPGAGRCRRGSGGR